MKFSICIPVYNGGKFIKKAIDSVLAQTYENWELVIYNNGSTDNTSSIINSYVDSRIRIYEEAKVVSEAIPAWNKAMFYGTGDYVLMLGVDDWFHKTYLEEVNEILSAHHFDLLGGNIDCFDLDYNFVELVTGASTLNKLENKEEIGALIKFSGKDFINAFVKDFEAGFSKFHLSTTMMKREVFEKVGGFNEKLQYCGEAELYLKIAQAGDNFGYYKKVLVDYIGYGEERRAFFLPAGFKYHDFFKIPYIMYKEKMINLEQYELMRLHVYKTACKQGFNLKYSEGIFYIGKYFEHKSLSKKALFLLLLSFSRIAQLSSFIVKKILSKL